MAYSEKKEKEKDIIKFFMCVCFIFLEKYDARVNVYKIYNQ